MNKRFLASLAVLVAVLATSFYFFIPRPDSPAQLSTISNTPDSGSNVESMFLQAYTGNESIRCNITQDGASSVAYIKKGKVRFNSMGADGQQFGNAILDGNTAYAWQTGSNEGMVIDVSQITGGNLMNQFMNLNTIREEIEKNNPTCVKEPVDDSVFIPPSSVKFTNAEELMQTQQLQGQPTQ